MDVEIEDEDIYPVNICKAHTYVVVFNRYRTAIKKNIGFSTSMEATKFDTMITDITRSFPIQLVPGCVQDMLPLFERQEAQLSSLYVHVANFDIGVGLPLQTFGRKKPRTSLFNVNMLKTNLAILQ